MPLTEVDVVTGALGYTGRYIARRLLARDRRVVTLTAHPDRFNPFGTRVGIFPFDFDNPEALVARLRGVATLYNTYWVRSSHGEQTFARAVENTRVLINAAVEAGVQRIVHVSITNPSEDSPLPYFRGKALLERCVIESGLSYAIIRPTVIFGCEDILINNIAWLLRAFPVFVVPGSGAYRMQPMYVEDLADLAIAAAGNTDDMIVDAVGPDIFTFDELVQLIAEKVQSRAKILHLPPRVALFASRLIGRLLGDVLLTRDELDGLMADLLVSNDAPTGSTRLADWLDRKGHDVGRKYSSELERHYGRAHE